MGWCSGTIIFDAVLDALLKPDADKEVAIRTLVEALEEMDWDCQGDSEHYNHPIVQKIMRERHPRWFE